MSLHIPFDNTYARLPAQLFSQQQPTPVSAPRLLAFNHALADDLGITGTGDEDELASIFSGNVVPKGAEPLAQLYGGHQFGHWNPQLGDGRAILLGESNGLDIQLKGSGRTQFSRRGDGRAWLGPVLREYVVSEAMHALGIPTTRALAAVETGDFVQRETVLPGAVLTRIASSHLRVGTFQILAARKDLHGLQAIFDYAIERQYPTVTSPTGFLQAVMQRQVDLVADWMSVGFIHGVMNTDNCAISGETIDYGPCAFMDEYHPMTVFSSIDRQGRYAYSNQPDIIVWNMAQLATALVPLMPDTDAAVSEFTEVIHTMPDLFQNAWLARFRRKIGLTSDEEGDAKLIGDLLTLMAESQIDFTNTFRDLHDETLSQKFADPHRFEAWKATWQARLERETEGPITTMTAANPALIPRNHRIEHMIQSAVAGDYAPFERLMAALSKPYSDDPAHLDLRLPPQESERVQNTFCGT